MNSTSDSGEFQEVESNYSGRLSFRVPVTFPVNLQWFRVLVPCWAATNDCLLTHSLHLDYRKTFWVINFRRLIRPEIILMESSLAQHRERTRISSTSFTRTLRRRTVSRNRKPRRRTCFYEEDRSLSWSVTSFVLLVLMIHRLRWFYFLSRFVTIIFRSAIQDGMKFYYLSQRFHPMISWKVCTNWEYVSLINSKPYENSSTWRFIRRYRCPSAKSLRRW